MALKNALLAAGGLGLSIASPVAAQDVSAKISPAASNQPEGKFATADEYGEILATARKRQESILKVPVVAAVIGQEALENYQISDITQLSARAPGLVTGGAVLAIGPQISIRGVGTSTLDAGVDQRPLTTPYSTLGGLVASRVRIPPNGTHGL